VNLGFERLPGRLDAPVRLFRRRRNLAAKAIGREVESATGIYPLLSVQGAVLSGDEREPGPIRIVLDVRLVNRLDIPLAALAGGFVGGVRSRYS